MSQPQGENRNDLRWRVDAATEKLRDVEQRLRTLEEDRRSFARLEERFTGLGNQFAGLKTEVHNDVDSLKKEFKEEANSLRRIIIGGLSSLVVGAIIFALYTSQSGGI